MMKLGKASIGAAILATMAVTSLSIYYYLGHKMTHVHTLQFPLLLGGPEGNGPFQLLPKGTTLYYDQSYPEGFTRYIVYVNVDHFPLPTRELSDPTEISPLTAFAMDPGDLKRVLDRNPITKEELRSILKSDQLSKQEIRELLAEYSQ